ncbi:hypothetical protein [Campylobacter volucris]|uniref:hypothetical protein n=1 Tax=Campylobacter volucris TaxID=1031542 RepID=UPI0018A05F01|nr:hypothetical protein [Campylobacter volucris]MBF7049746.1 hypothetical protein [Campylobacter volucris]
MFFSYYLSGKQFKHPIILWKNVSCKKCNQEKYIEYTQLQKEIFFHCSKCNQENIFKLQEIKG